MARPVFDDSVPAFPAAQSRPASPRPAAGRPVQNEPMHEGTAVLAQPPVAPLRGRSTTSGIGTAPRDVRDLPPNRRSPPVDDERGRSPKGALGALGALGAGRAAHGGDARTTERTPDRPASARPAPTHAGLGAMRAPAASVPPLDALIPKTKSTNDAAATKGGTARPASHRPRPITTPPTNTRSTAPQATNAPISFPPPPNTKAMPIQEETLAMVRAPVPAAYSTVPLAPPIQAPHRPSAPPRHASGAPPAMGPMMQSGATIATLGPPVAPMPSMTPPPPALGTLSPPAMPHGMPMVATAGAPAAASPGVLGLFLFAAPLALATAVVAALALAG